MIEGKRGIFFIISGPAGSGKGTVAKMLVDNHKELKLSVSATTREPRHGETDREHYYFISREEFEKRLKNDEILEYNVYNGNYYGTPKKEVLETISDGTDVILEIDVNGAIKVKELMGDDAVMIMLTPPDSETLEKRLRGRGTETEDVIKWRLARAKEEIKLIEKYDYSVINEDGKAFECSELIYGIIVSERHKTKRTKSIIEKFI